jgi:hypothetical protein
MLIAGALSLAALTAGCATPTPYQPNLRGQAISGGYTETQITADRYRVSFSGNTLTKRDTVERYLLYRAAELTLSKGADWFEMDDRRTDANRETYVDPYPFRGGFGPYGFWRPSWRYYGRPYGYGYGYGYGFGRSGSLDSVFGPEYDVHTSQRFEASAEIILHRGPPPAGMSRAFDARQVQANLEPTIVRPQPRG